MSEAQNSKRYDLEERTFKFACDVRTFVKILPKTVANIEDGKQLVRSSGSVGANYIEARACFKTYHNKYTTGASRVVSQTSPRRIRSKTAYPRSRYPDTAPSSAPFLSRILRGFGLAIGFSTCSSEALSKKDFYHRIKICRKEAKESVYWLRLLDIGDDTMKKECENLIAEAIELQKIFGAIVTNNKLRV